MSFTEAVGSGFRKTHQSSASLECVYQRVFEKEGWLTDGTATVKARWRISPTSSTNVVDKSLESTLSFRIRYREMSLETIDEFYRGCWFRLS